MIVSAATVEKRQVRPEVEMMIRAQFWNQLKGVT